MQSLTPYLGRLSARAERRHCAMCGKDLTLRVRLECSECSDCEVCLQCVARGEETSEHSRTHRFKVVDKNHFKLLDVGEEWLAVEEELLLEAIENYGLGNWSDIAQHVGDHRSSKEVEQHFNAVYLQSDGIISQHTAQHKTPCPLPGEAGWESLLLTNPAPPLQRLRPGQELSMSYSQHRDEFDAEFANDAEELIAGLEFSSEDDQLETSVKFAQVEIYMSRVRERSDRKRLAHHNNLITGQNVFISSKKRHIQDEKEFREQHKVISRLNPEQYEHYLHSFVREKTLKQKIRELTRYRKNGLTQLNEIKEFENAKKLRDQIKTDKSALKSHKSPLKGLSHPNSSEILRMRYNYELLSTAEKELCSEIGISSSQYNTGKLKYFLAYNRDSGSSREIAREVVGNDLKSEQANRLDAFFELSGWLYK